MKYKTHDFTENLNKKRDEQKQKHKNEKRSISRGIKDISNKT